MCGHLNLKLAISLNVKSVFRVSQSAAFLLCTSVIGELKINHHNLCPYLPFFFLISLVSCRYPYGKAQGVYRVVHTCDRV